MNIFAICEQWNGTSLYTTFPRGSHWSKIINSAAAGVQHGWILIPAWISNNISSKVCDEITYPFPNFNDCTVEVWEWISNFNTRFIGPNGCNFLSMSWYHGDAMTHGIVLIDSCLEKLSLYDACWWHSDYATTHEAEWRTCASVILIDLSSLLSHFWLSREQQQPVPKLA